jgi:predicted GH43/DUF377 family glycosyl hydrolase
MRWKKLGQIFNPIEHSIDWLKSHSMVPTPLELEDRIRVFYAGRSHSGESKISYFDVDKDDPSKLIGAAKQALFNVGEIGQFDDSGTICTCAVKFNGNIYIYYTAYSISHKVPYRNSIGIAISEDGGQSFRRMFDGPILDRSKNEPYFVISPWVIQMNDSFHMWYASATRWVEVGGKQESVYHIKYATSDNGIDWHQTNESCIIPLHEEEANARPSVILEDGKLKMWFTYRGSRDFRDGPDSYRIGYAEARPNRPSEWHRMDERSGIIPGPEKFDNLMQAYPAVIQISKKKYLFYNGNGFGYTGVCCAEWID